MIRIGLFAAAAVALIGAQAPAMAGAVESGFAATTLDRGDDFFVGPLAIGFNVNFFGSTASNLFLGNNGYVTFGSGQSDYTPVGLGAGYSGQAIIAAFYADVETTPADGGTVGYGTGTFNGRNAFGATWNDVGYYNDKTDKLNTFQLLLVDRADVAAGDFDIYLNYDKVQWETGDADDGVGGLGGDSASVGYNAGTGNAAGTYFSFAGSQVNGALIDGGANALVANSNVGLAGRYLFNVRSGTVTPPPAVPEPASWAMMIAGFGLTGGAMRRRATRRFARA